MRRKNMKMCSVLFALFIVSFSGNLLAAWELATPNSSMPREPFFQAGGYKSQSSMSAPEVTAPQSPSQRAANHQRATYPRAERITSSHPVGPGTPLYAVSISGSLKENFERIMGRYHWKVIWKAPYDYNFDGRVTGSSLPNVVEKLLQPFPLQAVMYMSNRTVAIIPRQDHNKV